MNLLCRFQILICFLFLIFSTYQGHSQEIFKRRSVYGELLGAGLNASVNVDFRIFPGNDGTGLRLGVGGLPNGIVFPIGINEVMGEKKIAVEYGTGITTAIITNPVSQNLTFNNGSKRF